MQHEDDDLLLLVLCSRAELLRYGRMGMPADCLPLLLTLPVSCNTTCFLQQSLFAASLCICGCRAAAVRAHGHAC
jgi:hypothetical protein